MSSDFEAYEQDFGTLTAEITNKIGRIPKLAGEEKTQLVLNVDKQLEEVRELLEQMDLEVREIPIQSRGMYNSRLKSYKQEMEKLEKDFKRSRIAYSDEVRNELLGDDGSSSESQRAHLLDNTERLERSSRRLEAGYQIAVETETARNNKMTTNLKAPEGTCQHITTVTPSSSSHDGFCLDREFAKDTAHSQGLQRCDDNFWTG
ncbi:vesicle transport through interaction with t-SNAREs homolog 1A isoform X2 [Sinocyclocheilus grahami]|uniref:vesicle transport through interaction with t-SNAREs homolog 1A isoform X2 n=1 Tax=Sinocyclocheilus grahami TaxID=75366 RepID=UPI0007ACA0B5|nr:PREDICTED: vesicle transport through interaction with t-SNAREs homolog 1A-like isoform X2 [Sinocyclocheilus grahami]